MALEVGTVCGVLASACLFAGCLFPSLDGLSSDLTTTDSGASACPDVNDPSLQVYLRLDEGAGSVAIDCSSHHHDGLMVTDAGAWTTGKRGSALLVSSAGSGCLGIAGFDDGGGAFTVTAWVRVDKAPAPNLPGFIVAKSDNLNTEGWRMATEQSNTAFALTLGGVPDAGLDQFGSNATYQVGVWTYVTMVIDPGNRDAIYINGVLDMTKSAPDTIVSSKAELRLGCRGDGALTTYFDGAIDEVRIYDRALSAAEIAALYAVP